MSARTRTMREIYIRITTYQATASVVSNCASSYNVELLLLNQSGINIGGALTIRVQARIPGTNVIAKIDRCKAIPRVCSVPTCEVVLPRSYLVLPTSASSHLPVILQKINPYQK